MHDKPVWVGPAEDDWTHPNRPSSLPTDLPIPMPNPDEAERVEGTPGTFLYHDLKTNETYPITLPSNLSGLDGGNGSFQFGGIWNGTSNHEGQRTFADLELANSPDTFPRSTACRLRMQFTDVDGLEWVFVGSGHLIDAETLLTAGHCVYTDDFVDGNGVTRIVNNWADWIEVYPGSHDGTDYWGRSDATILGAFTGWTENDDFDWDIGVIRINRAVGMLAGWTGWRWGDSCSTIRARQYHNFSYPAADCGEDDADGDPLHNGRDMYYRQGEFDSCPGNQLHIDTTAGCFTTSHGGMSGSGYYFIDGDGDRRVHAQHSNGNGSTSSNGAKIWENFSDYLVDEFVPDSRGPNFDLQAMYIRSDAGVVEPASYSAGDTIDDLRFTSANATNGADSGTWNFDVYISTDDIIDTSDTFIDEKSYTWDYTAMQEVNVGFSNVELPLGLPTGTYWLGVRFNSNTDNASWNNETSEWDAYEIYVQAVTDAEAVSIVPLDTHVIAGDFLNYSAIVGNNGAQTSNIVVDVYASTNQTITEYDTLLGTIYTSFSSPGTVEIDSPVLIPNSLSDGEYYLGLIVEPNYYEDVDSSNNVVASDITFQKVTPPSNDNCEDAVVIGFGDTEFSTLYATTDGSEHPECEESGDGGATVHDIWYTFDSPASGTITISTCNQVDYDSDLVLYNGGCGAPNLVGCNDDGAGCSAYSSLLEAPVQQGVSYLLRVGGWNYNSAGEGTLTLSVEPSETGDINGDGLVDIEDLLLLLAAWGGEGNDGTDLDGNGVVDVEDLLIMIANFGA
ncbi:MAG: hypothetical protein QGI78_00715 [Phycisphaerales bacterium]|jgi:hypothetical protein|nr:hypothetical protein [Phycisphaerales bacterium]